MLDLFGYEDEDGDELIIRPSTMTPGSLMFHCDGYDGSRRSARVPREKVERLYAALGEWLYPVHTPEGPNRSLIEQMIERNVREQITAILPLHLKPFATQMQAAEQCRGGYGCDTLGVHAAYGSGCGRPDPDPEPGDVGHPRPYFPPVHMTSEADCNTPGCTSLHLGGIHGRPEGPRPCDELLKPDQPLAEVHKACGFIWMLHKMAAPSKFERPLSPEAKGRLMKNWTLLPRRVPSCIECLHGWGEHTGGICWGTGGQDHEGDGCRCTRERPSAAIAPCTCSPNTLHPHGADGCMHPSCTCKQERP